MLTFLKDVLKGLIESKEIPHRASLVNIGRMNIHVRVSIEVGPNVFLN